MVVPLDDLGLIPAGGTKTDRGVVMRTWMMLVLVAGALAGCESGMPNDVVEQQEKWRQEHPLPTALDLPPGLSEDLPQPAATAPMVKE